MLNTAKKIWNKLQASMSRERAMHDLEEISRLLDAYSKAITLSMARYSDS